MSNDRVKTDDSAALRFLLMMWENDGEAFGGHSWTRLNSGMFRTLALAVGHGFKFGLDDFSRLSGLFNFGYWGGADGGFAERFYTLACGVGGHGDATHGVNLSACRSFEAWKKREPFILKDRDCPSGRRLAVQSRFAWQGEWVTVTSFADDGASLTACTYKDSAPGKYERKVARRFRITVDHVKAASAAFVKAKKAAAKKEAAAAPS